MFICKCGELFDRPKVREDGGDKGEYFAYCPACGGVDYAEAKRCRRCGDWVSEYEIEQGYCDLCLSEIGYDEQVAWEFGEENKVDVPVNGLYAYLFNEEEIDTILYEAAKKAINNNEHKNYWRQDADAFARFIKKQEAKK